MELRTLRYFLTVAYEGNISRAAESLYIAQPSLSRQIQGLEKELGCQLFIRKSHRVELTPEGLELRSRATEVLEMVGRIEDEFAQRDAAAIVGDALAVTFQGVGGYDTDELTFRSFEPRLETGSVFAWKRHRTFSEASRVFLDAMRAQLEG